MRIIISTIPRYADLAMSVVSKLKTSQLEIKVRVVSFGLSEKFKTADEYIDTEFDHGWSDNMILGIADLADDDYIILSMDDLILCAAPSKEVFRATTDYFINHNYDAVSLYSPPSDRISQSIRGNFVWHTDQINKNYPISCMFTLFRCGFLREILMSGQSAWEFELTAKTKIDAMKTKPKISALSYNLVDLTNVVIKGQFVNWRATESVPINLPSMSNISKFKHILKIFIVLIYRFEFRKLCIFMIH